MRNSDIERWVELGYIKLGWTLPDYMTQSKERLFSNLIVVVGKNTRKVVDLTERITKIPDQRAPVFTLEGKDSDALQSLYSSVLANRTERVLSAGLVIKKGIRSHDHFFQFMQVVRRATANFTIGFAKTQDIKWLGGAATFLVDADRGTVERVCWDANSRGHFASQLVLVEVFR